jgi:hypothetical protein
MEMILLWLAFILVTVVLLFLYQWLSETTDLCTGLVKEIKKLKTEIGNREWLDEAMSAAAEVCEICDEISGTGLVDCEICGNAICQDCYDKCEVAGIGATVVVCVDCLENEEI